MHSQAITYITLLLIAATSYGVEAAPIDNRLLQSISPNALELNAWMPKHGVNTEKKAAPVVPNKDSAVPSLTPLMSIIPVVAKPIPVAPVATPPTPASLPSTTPALTSPEPLAPVSENDAALIATADADANADAVEDMDASEDAIDEDAEEDRMNLMKQQRFFFNQDPFYNPNERFILDTERAKAEQEERNRPPSYHDESRSMFENGIGAGISGAAGKFFNFFSRDEPSHPYHGRQMNQLPFIDPHPAFHSKMEVEPVETAQTKDDVEPAMAAEFKVQEEADMPIRHIRISMPSTMDWVVDDTDEQ